MWDKIVYIVIITIVMLILKDKLYKMAKTFEYYYKFTVINFFMAFNSLILMPLFFWNGKTVMNASLMAEVSKHVTKLIGVTWHLRNPEIVSENRGAVIVVNHQSLLDLLGLCNLWYAWKKVAVVVKKEFFYFWPFGLGLYMMDAIFVDRRNPKTANEILMTQSNKILQDKSKILIFPEGTRNSDFRKMLPFKKGAFNIAVSTQAPIIPIVISRYYFINHRQRIFNGGKVVAKCLEPVSTEGLTLDDIPELIKRVQNDMEKAFKELTNEVIRDLPPDYPLAIEP